ncbi:hypothetical protein [Cellvibrio sp. OA-2007]|uniref:hypothetical protein n=1 Tax=Cellvibrio sp. OA-2007 TaxID=529823 RepID=UPI0007812DB2|nr:hypothetical protein [Cellvibrio sp. OA-2007]
MKHLNQAVSINIVLVLSALMMAAAANASMLDCGKSLRLELVASADCVFVEMTAAEGKVTVGNHSVSAPATNTPGAGFQVNQTRTASAIPESAPLLVLIGALLAVLLVRAKSYNTK